jgi:hypothetical protein
VVKKVAGANGKSKASASAAKNGASRKDAAHTGASHAGAPRVAKKPAPAATGKRR